MTEHVEGDDLLNAAVGQKLRSIRLQWQFTLREVQEKSEALAERWRNQSFRISASWLARIESGKGGMSATKMVALTSIYGLSAEQSLSLFSALEDASSGSHFISEPNATLLLLSGPLTKRAEELLPNAFATDEPPSETGLLPRQTSLPAHFRRGIIGKNDRTMEPMIRPGSIVLIDTQKRSIAGRQDWNHEFDRPIYFLLTREQYLMGFCELDKAGAWLTLVPHVLSRESNRRWRYRKEIEVLGTVTAVSVGEAKEASSGD